MEVYVDSVIRDAIIYNSGGPHLGDYTGPLFNVVFHMANEVDLSIIMEQNHFGKKKS